MNQKQTSLCRECGLEFTFSLPAQPENAAAKLPPRAPARCPDCQKKRMAEDAALLEKAKNDPALAHAYRCRRCQRIFLLLRPWKRAGGLLFCPVCRPAMYRTMPFDEALNDALGYPQ